MKGKWRERIGVAVVALGSGCTSLDKYRHYERSHRRCRKSSPRCRNDLQNADCRTSSQHADRSLDDQVATKDQAINSLQAEAESLRNAWPSEEILKKMAGTATTPTSSTSPPCRRTSTPPSRELVNQYPDLLSYDEKTGAVRGRRTCCSRSAATR